MEMLTYFKVFHPGQVNISAWFLVLPIDRESIYRLLRGLYLSLSLSIYIYIEFLASHFCYLSRSVSKFTEWALIEELSILCIDMNVILDHSTAIQQFLETVSIASLWVNADLIEIFSKYSNRE